ncbi:major facilitator superfamily domain-containing protein [Pilobolus umbonatus]|nr:major facilitator superfamily domain-containing protein [Pilobolus umbonatus]
MPGDNSATCLNIEKGQYENTDSSTEGSKEIEIVVPDGGYGWVIVLGGFAIQMTVFGVLSCCQRVFSESPNALVELSFVSVPALVLIAGCSPIVHILMSFINIRKLMIIALIIHTLGLQLSAISTTIWHLYLTQGVLYGLGAAVSYTVSMIITSQWFDKRKGLALGLASAGSGFGGLVFPYVMTTVNNRLGHQWTYHVLGFICFILNMFNLIVMREKVPTTKVKKSLSSIIKLEVLKDTNFVLFILASNVLLTAYYIPFFYLPSYASYLGLDDTQGSSLVSIVSIHGIVGRIMAGFIGDQIGIVNTHIIFVILSGLSCLFIWTFAYSYAYISVFAAIYGFTCGSFFALMSPITMVILGREKFTSGLPLLLLINSISVCGPSIASVIQTNINNIQPFIVYKLFTGAAYILAALVLFVLRFRINKNPFVKI